MNWFDLFVRRKPRKQCQVIRRTGVALWEGVMGEEEDHRLPDKAIIKAEVVPQLDICLHKIKAMVMSPNLIMIPVHREGMKRNESID